jgi:hypothetical protein
MPPQSKVLIHDNLEPEKKSLFDALVFNGVSDERESTRKVSLAAMGKCAKRHVGQSSSERSKQIAVVFVTFAALAKPPYLFIKVRLAMASKRAKRPEARISSERTMQIAALFVTLVVLATSSYLFISRRFGIPTENSAAVKTDFQPSASIAVTAKHSSPLVVREQGMEPRIAAPTNDDSGKQDQMPPEPAPSSIFLMSGREQLTDPNNWVIVRKSPDLETFFFKDVPGKGGTDARVSMLTNFVTAQSLPDGSDKFLSIMYVISIDCKTSSGRPVEVVRNTDRFLSAEILNHPMPPVKATQFSVNDPMLLFACN